MVSRKIAFALASFLTAVVTAAVVVASGVAKPADASDLTPGLSAADKSLAVLISPDAVYAEREASLQAHLAELQSTLQTLDAGHQQQVDQAQGKLAQMETFAEVKTANLIGLQDVLSVANGSVDQDALAYQQQVAALQQRDLQLQQQLESTLVELQAAYDEIAARQVVQASGGGTDSGNQGESRQDDDDDDHEEHEEHDDDD